MLHCPHCNNEIVQGESFCSYCGFDLSTFSNKSQNSTVLVDINNDSVVLKIGSLLDNRFFILEKIGSGGMGIVYRAKDLIFDEIVALKVIKKEFAHDERMINRFKQEIKIARKIKHPNVCSIFNFSKLENFSFMIMEYLEGESLSAFLKRKSFPSELILYFIKQILYAIEEAHRKDIVHLDLKPSNIMLDNHFKPIILDFGISSFIGKINFSSAELITGTLAYMSPEQIKGNNFDQRSDIYSLGLIFYKLLVGKHPFNAQSAEEMLKKQLFEKPVSPSISKPSVPVFWDKIILKCLEKLPENRYNRISDILADLEEGRQKQFFVLKRGKILTALYEDEFRKKLSLLLKKEGYGVIEIINVKKILEKVISEKPELIILDFSRTNTEIKEVDSVIKYLKEHRQKYRPPIIILTSSIEAEYVFRSDLIGIYKYLRKPVKVNELYFHIQDALLQNVKKLWRNQSMVG